MKIITEPELFTRNNSVGIEGYYDADYVCETCLRSTSGGWVNFPVAIFYQPELFRVPEGGSQWFGIYRKAINPFDENSETQLTITNAISAVEEDIQGIMAKNGDVIYSHYRHDYRHSEDGTVWIDGGRDYTRSGLYPDAKDLFKTLRIVEGALCVV